MTTSKANLKLIARRQYFVTTAKDDDFKWKVGIVELYPTWPAAKKIRLDPRCHGLLILKVWTRLSRSGHKDEDGRWQPDEGSEYKLTTSFGRAYTLAEKVVADISSMGLESCYFLKASGYFDRLADENVYRKR